MKRPQPIDAAREFRIDEMFFSTTDRKGVILSGNDVFVRVSGYARHELVGKPHNIIRHPEMPRAVFRLIWSRLLAASPVAGLVKNLAADGRHYSVIALLLPVGDGFLSVRFKPSSELTPRVAALYRRMRACEEAARDGGADGPASMDAAEKLLADELRAQGFESYDAFMRKLLHEELKSRDATLAREKLRLFPAEAISRNGGEIAIIDRAARRAYREINTLYAQLDEFASLNERLAERSAFVLGLTQEFRFIAFNAALRSARVGVEGSGLAVIADYLGASLENTSNLVGAFTERTRSVSTGLSAVIFDLAAARLQIEMVIGFCGELLCREAKAGADADGCRRMIGQLQAGFAGTIARAAAALLAIERELGRLGENSEELRRLVLALQVAQVGGLVEARRLKEDDSFEVMFGDLRVGIERTKTALADLDQARERLRGLADQTPAIQAEIGLAVREIDAVVMRLAVPAD